MEREKQEGACILYIARLPLQDFELKLARKRDINQNKNAKKVKAV